MYNISLKANVDLMVINIYDSVVKFKLPQKERDCFIRFLKFQVCVFD